MTVQDIPGAVVSVLQALVHLGVAREIAALTDISQETIYRHGRQEGAKGRPRRMDGGTLSALADLFLELGVLENPDYSALRAAEKEIRRRAIARLAADGLDEIGKRKS